MSGAWMSDVWNLTPAYEKRTHAALSRIDCRTQDAKESSVRKIHAWRTGQPPGDEASMLESDVVSPSCHALEPATRAS
jgi:hypothetical protein